MIICVVYVEIRGSSFNSIISSRYNENNSFKKVEVVTGSLSEKVKSFLANFPEGMIASKHSNNDYVLFTTPLMSTREDYAFANVGREALIFEQT